MKVIIDIPEEVYKRTIFYREFRDLNDCVKTIKALENGTPLDDVKAEIESLPTDKITEYRRAYIFASEFKTKVLEILDRIGTAESEVKNEQT